MLMESGGIFVLENNITILNDFEGAALVKQGESLSLKVFWPMII